MKYLLFCLCFFLSSCWAQNMIQIKVHQQVFQAKLADTKAAQTFVSHLPISLEMLELNQNEKYATLSFTLPQKANHQKIHTGDLMLFGSDCLVLFYESFETSYRYTPIGQILDPKGLKEALGKKSVVVHFEKSLEFDAKPKDKKKRE